MLVAMRLLLVAASYAFLSVVCSADDVAPSHGSPAANFRDDTLLEISTTEVGDMSRHELDLLTDALATCEVAGLKPEDSLRQPCEIAQQRYTYAYANRRPIDRLLAALWIMENHIRLQDETLPRKSQKRGEIAKDIERLVYITGKLGDAISARNIVLNQTR
jgi:hypothetical protein